MPDVSMPLNVPGYPLEVFRNEDASGWMKVDEWDNWRRWMNGDATERGRGRRTAPAYRAKAAALITGAQPDQADRLASDIYREQKARWEASHGFGQVVYQFYAHLPIQHYIGTIALNFIPYIGPILSMVAQNMTPMVEAASEAAIKKHEAMRVSEGFRAEYYKAMDEWLRGGAQPDEAFLQYHADVVVPAALDVRSQIESGLLETETGTYSMTSGGWTSFQGSGEMMLLPVYGNVFTRSKDRVLFEIEANPGAVLAGLAGGVLAMIVTWFAVERVAA